MPWILGHQDPGRNEVDQGSGKERGEVPWDLGGQEALPGEYNEAWGRLEP